MVFYFGNTSTNVGYRQAMSSDKYVGLALAVSSNLFIGVSFIITKRGLINSEGHGGFFPRFGGPAWGSDINF